MSPLDDVRKEVRRRGWVLRMTDYDLRLLLWHWLIEYHHPQKRSDANRCEGKTNDAAGFVTYLETTGQIML